MSERTIRDVPCKLWNKMWKMSRWRWARWGRRAKWRGRGLFKCWRGSRTQAATSAAGALQVCLRSLTELLKREWAGAVQNASNRLNWIPTLTNHMSRHIQDWLLSRDFFVCSHLKPHFARANFFEVNSWIFLQPFEVTHKEKRITAFRVFEECSLPRFGWEWWGNLERVFFSCKTAWKFFSKKDLVLVVSSRVVRIFLDMSSSGMPARGGLRNWRAHHVLITLLPYIQLDSFIPFWWASLS